jgi:hypothetical protein
MGGVRAYDDGKIFITRAFSVLICMDARTGRDIWRKDRSMPIVNAPVVNGGRIFVPPMTIIFTPLPKSMAGSSGITKAFRNPQAFSLPPMRRFQAKP